MIDFSDFFEEIEDTPLSTLANFLSEKIRTALDPANNNDLQKWQQVLKSLPSIEAASIDLNSTNIDISPPENFSATDRKKLEALLLQFHPWRKGPFKIHGIAIDTEWRSDLKWQRLEDHIRSLTDRTVLDVGCGSGYHCFRMVGAGAKLVLGLDPGLVSVMQFFAVKHFTGNCPAYVLPLSLEQIEDNLRAFDTVFSMGVLYHRRSPFDHLYKLKSCLREGGELVLETLVIDGKAGEILVPESRYAKMRNVWFLPTCLTLESWLRRCGFKNIQLVDVVKTSSEEQRKTEWMTYESLTDFLNPQNKNLTIEGYPAPKRAIFIAQSA